MPVSATLLTSGTGGTSASITPGANRLILAVFSGNSSATGSPGGSVSGCGLTWTSVAEQLRPGSSNFAFHVFKAYGTPSTGTLTISSATGTITTHAVIEVADCDDIINTSLTYVGGAGSQSQSTTLGSFSSANNGTFGSIYKLLAGDVTAGSGFTELSDVNNSFHQCFTEWKNSNDTSVDCSWTGFSEHHAFGGELQYVAPPTGSTLRQTNLQIRSLLAM